MFAERLPQGAKMGRHSESYLTGKAGESQTWDYLARAGYIRPSAKQRANIIAAFKQGGVTVHKRGFDVVPFEFAAALDSVEVLVKQRARLRLLEVKTCGANRKAEVSAGFKGLGFTLTNKERQNAEALGDQYRFLFVNLRAGVHRECALIDFFVEGRARIYQTWSVFLTQDLPVRLPAEPVVEAETCK
jgi:hypothetical protein